MLEMIGRFGKGAQRNDIRMRAAIILLTVILSFPPAVRAMGTGTACIKKSCFTVEVAVSLREQSRGLMYRAALGARSGMLFVFPGEGQHLFWMKNTLIALDIIWIGGDNRVIYIKKNAPPCRTDACPEYGPSGKAAYVLEINGGLSEKLGLAAGDEATLKIKY